jgi:peptidyl-prolyl cis-trans isomerase D
MLQTIRDRLTGPVVWVVIGLISVPFAIWGVQSFQSGGSDPAVAEVGGVKITQSQFRKAYEQHYRQLQQLMGENFRADEIDQAAQREQVLKGMVQDLLLRQYAHDAGYRVDDGALRQYLEVIPAFQDQGRFSAQRYREVLASVGQSPDRFEAQQREALTVEQLRNSVLGSAFVTPGEVSAGWRLAQQERSFSYVQFAPAKYLGSITISEDRVKQRYEEKKANYQAPERIQLSYLELALDQLPKGEPPSQEMLKTLYDAEKDSRFSSPEERHASHILISFGADKDASKKKAEGIRQQLRQGADFAELARASSEDPGSKGKGGDLGWVKHGTLTPKFEAALYALRSEGDISEPVETEFGWHIIRLVALRPAHTDPFESPAVQKTLLDLFQQRHAEQTFQDMSDKLGQLAFENPTSLDPAAKALDLKVQTSEWFTRAGGAGVAANRDVIAAAFSREVLQDGDNSKPIVLDASHVAVVRKAAYEAPRQRELAEVADQIRDELKSEAARAQAQSEAAAFLAALQGGQSIAEAAKARNLSVVSRGSVRRDMADVDKALLEAVFKMPRPVNGKPSRIQAPLQKDEVAVIELDVVKDPPPPAFDAPDLKRDANAQRDAIAGAEFGAYRKGIERQVKVSLKNPPAVDTEAPAP